MSEARKDTSFKDLIGQLTHDVTALIRQEVQLAKTETSEKVDMLGSGIASLVVGAVIALAGVIVLLFSAVDALASVMDVWLAALIVGGIVTIIGVILLMKGRNSLKPDRLMPTRTTESLRQDTKVVERRM